MSLGARETAPQVRNVPAEDAEEEAAGPPVGAAVAAGNVPPRGGLPPGSALGRPGCEDRLHEHRGPGRPGEGDDVPPGGVQFELGTTNELLGCHCLAIPKYLKPEG